MIRPSLIGDKMKINACSVFIVFMIWSFVSGVSGMILFIPIAGTITILLEGHKVHESYAMLYSEPHNKPKTSKIPLDEE